MIENADQQVLSQLTRWITAGKKSWLATVVKTWGSSPRPVGSLLCCNEDGHVAGSLSGGCIEEDLLEKITNGELATTKPEVMLYGKTTEESERFGLPTLLSSPRWTTAIYLTSKPSPIGWCNANA
jgi:xanthine dehydrogenase accessory factor